MRSFALSSGSSGNCFYVESKKGIKILVDLGLSFKKTKEILDSRDVDINQIDAILITHEHSDHIFGLEGFIKNLNCPVYLTKGTQDGVEIISEKFRIIKNSEVIEVNDIKMFVIESLHDAREPVSFVFDDGVKLGIFTDLGEIGPHTREILKGLDHIYLETNYCHLKIKEEKKNLSSYYVNRLVSNRGHLGLDQALDVLRDSLRDSQKVVLSHISENTNSYENCYIKVKELIDNLNLDVDLQISFQGSPGVWIE